MVDAEGLARQRVFVDSMRERILPLRRRAEVRNEWLRQRLDAIMPEVMAREGFDMWIIAAREYNEDPVIMTLLPEPAMAARRRTILVFARRPDGGVERLTLDEDPALTARLADPSYRGRPERIIKLRLEAFDWNCPQHIVPRYTEAQIDAIMARQMPGGLTAKRRPADHAHGPESLS